MAAMKGPKCALRKVSQRVCAPTLRAIKNRMPKLTINFITVITVIKFIVSFGILFFIARKVGAQTLWETLRKAHLGPFIAAILSYFVVQGLSAYRWYVLLKPLGLKI